MADSEQVSSTSPLGEELDKLHDHEMGDSNEAVAKEVVNEDEIVDLVGGAQDAIERHKATISYAEDIPQKLTEMSSTPDHEPMLLTESVPVVSEPMLVPNIAPPTVVEDATEQLTKEEAIPDSTVAEKEQKEEVADIVPLAEPVHTEPVPEPVFIQEPAPQPEITPEPAPEPEIIPEPIPEPVPEPAPEPVIASVEPPKAVPEEVLLPKAAPEKKAAAAPPPASYAPFLPSLLPQPLMQFPTALGQRGDCPAPISPLSPLHSPDSLEELSLSESPNQPPTMASAPFSSSIEPPKVLSSAMPWSGEEEGNARFGHSKNDQYVEKGLESFTSGFELETETCYNPGKDLGPKSLLEDSGVSFSPEEKLSGSGRSTSPSQSPVSPQMTPESHIAPASSNPTEHWDSPFLASQDNSRVSMDTFSKDTTPIGSSGFEADMLGQSDDDLMFEVKKNPFQGFSPVADAGFSHYGDAHFDSRASKMSESPTPDLVQSGQGGGSQDSPPAFYDESKTYESVKMAADSLMQPLGQFSPGPKEDEDSVLLPDILKSSPLNPEKIDSGSSEGSLESSPLFERKMMESPNIPINLSATNPFAFDSKVCLLKEMAEATEAKSSVKVKGEDDCFGAFDLVKEAETTPMKGEKKPKEEQVQVEQKDWFSSHDSPKMTNKLEPLDFPSRKTPDDSDSESPTADSLSPVLEAMAKNPASFQVETEKNPRMEEAGEEVSEPEVSSEEFEFIERPPRGVIDEFLEAMDNSKFAKGPEHGADDDLSYGSREMAPPNIASSVAHKEESQSSQSPYLLLTQSSDKATPQKGKAELEKADIKEPPSQAPLLHSPVHKPVALAEDAGGPKMAHAPNLSTEAVVEFLYWRDVKATGVVFGASLLLLLSLTVCSIVSVCSYVGLALLSVTISFRIYKGILQAIQKSDEGHPFKLYLDQEVALSEDAVHRYSDVALARINKTVGDLRRLFLVEDLIDSIKFAVLMWILTYVGALFNGLTLLILGLVGAFSCPIIYEKHQVQIDHYLGMVNNQIKDVVAKIQAKVPGLKRKAE
ncbi:reticulon-4b isoform X7 [Hypomesus transpacificus]|uniref:reticulon-4b isoform X7 n=2 Tax=Hypomesus transpacificus TaxID=137520 RepID=UPI001F074082|nr:reticulon-4b isoform X7 [Hypomesus transpacificus]